MLPRTVCLLRQWLRSHRQIAIIAIAIATVALALFLDRTPARAQFNSTDCTFNGIKLYGRVREVENFADIEVKEVTSFPDLHVKKVTSSPDDCGEWQFVTNFPDFTIHYANSFPDLEIEFVDSFPGIP